MLCVFINDFNEKYLVLFSWSNFELYFLTKFFFCVVMTKFTMIHFTFAINQEKISENFFYWQKSYPWVLFLSDCCCSYSCCILRNSSSSTENSSKTLKPLDSSTFDFYFITLLTDILPQLYTWWTIISRR